MGFLRKKGSAPVTIPEYTGMRIQTSSGAVPVTIMWGTNQVSPNLLWYGNFEAMPQYSKGGGKGGGKTLTGYNYTAALTLGLCEGPAYNCGVVWQGQGTWPMWALDIYLIPGEKGNPPAYEVSITYPGIGYAGSGYYNLGSSPDLPSLQFEINGPLWPTAFVNALDADPALVIYDFLTNAQYGVGFPAQSIDATALLQGNPPTSAVTITIASPSVVTWATHGLSNGQVIGLTTTGTLPTGLQAGGLYYVVDATTNTFQLALSPGGAAIDTTGAQSGTQTAIAPGASHQAYCYAVGLCMSPVLSNTETASSILTRWLQITNSVAVWSGDRLKFIPYGDTPVAGQLVNGQWEFFAPNVTPVYNLDDDDFVGSADEDPVMVERVDPYSVYNGQQLEYSWRTNWYGSTTITAYDQGLIQQFGLRMGSSVSASEICDTNVAQKVLQSILQRACYIRNKYTFKLSFQYCLLEPMDIVTLTDSALGMTDAPVRILSIEEGDDGILTVTAEEFPAGVGVAAIYASQSLQAQHVNRNVVPSPVNPPVIFEPPPGLSGGTPQVWLTVSGGIPTVYKFAEDGSAGAHYAQAALEAQANGTRVNFQIYLQSVERSACMLQIFDGTNYQNASFHLSGAGAVSGQSTGVTASSIAPVTGTAWYLCSITCLMTATAAPIVYVLLENPLGTVSYAGTSGHGIYVWGAEIAFGDEDQSMIPMPMTPSAATFASSTGKTTPEGAEGTADPNWGGCNVYLSTDGNTYGEIGTITGPARQGVLTANLNPPTTPNPDTNTLSVSLVESGGTLATATDSDAANAVTLSLVDSELLAYGTATLTSANAYNLTYLYRGLYGTSPASHSIGAAFARLDGSIFKYTLPAGYIGVALYIKLQSFNIFGDALQDLSTCVVYTYTPTGAGAGLGPAASALASGTGVDLGLVSQIPPSESDQFGLVSDPNIIAIIQLGNASP